MSNLDSKEFGRHYIEMIWNQAELSQLDDLTATDIVRHDPASGVQHGIEEFRAVITALHTAFSPMHFTINWQVGEGDSTAQARGLRRGTDGRENELQIVTDLSVPYRLCKRNFSRPDDAWNGTRCLDKQSVRSLHLGYLISKGGIYEN